MAADLTHAQMLARTDPAVVGTVEPGSPEEAAAVERFKAYFSAMTPARVQAETAQVYAPEAILHDTLATHVGLEQIQPYFLRTAERAEGVTVVIDDWVRQGPDFYFRWTMDITWSAFKKGQTTRSVGMSQIRFDRMGRVVLHHDFWDSASGFFAHLPVIGWLIHWIKRQV